MCEAFAYLVEDGREILLLESVDILEPMPGGTYRLQNIFGEQTTVAARILRMELVNHKILFIKDK